MLSALELSAQSGGYSNLEFVENKGQWDTQVKFRAEINTGNFFLHKDGFTVLQHDTNDLKRIHRLLHGELPPPLAASSTGKAVTYVRPPMAPGSDPADKGQSHGGGGGGNSGAGDGGAGNGADPYLLHSHSYRVSFVGASDQVEIVPEKASGAYNNYFVGDRSRWASQVNTFYGVVYKNLYPGIDLHYYTDAGLLKYDLVIHPGADPNQIVLRYQGQSQLSINKGQLWVKTTVGTVKELEPHSYQVSQEGRKVVACSYSIQNGNTVRFKIKDYSPDATLVIDPSEVFCSFTGSRSDNWGYTATYDNAGNFYLGGIVINYPNGVATGNGNGFPASLGAFQSTFQGGNGAEGTYNSNPGAIYEFDVAIMKFNSSGSAVLYATYLGGSGDEQPHSMICDAQGNLIVTGRTASPQFPTDDRLTTNEGGTAGKGFDIFITKFNSTGTGLIGSMKIGGTGDDGVNYAPKYKIQGTHDLRLSYGDDGRGEIMLDNAGNIYVATCTRSTNFPVTPGVFQGTFGGGDQDGVLIKTTPDARTLLGASYLGGTSNDAAFVLGINPTDNTIYVAGGTQSSNFPGTGNGPVVRAANPNGSIDGFVSIISNDLSTLVKSTYFGTDAGTDMIYGIDFDKFGFPYITGIATSALPVVNSPFNQASGQAGGNQFITKLRPDLSSLVYSANFGPGGSAPNISPVAFLVDRCENVYVSGWGGGIENDEKYIGAGTGGLVTTPGAIKGNTDGQDFYFFVLQKNAASQLYGSFFGQQDIPDHTLGDHVDGGTSRFDNQGIIYQAICANCGGNTTFPTTPGVIHRSNGTGGVACNEAAVKISFNFAGVSAGLKLALHGRGDSVGCVPLPVSFQDTIRNAKKYIWDFGDGERDTTTNFSMDHSYTNVGNYRIMLIAIDSNSCNVADTVYRNITVKNNPATLDFDISKILPCTSYNYIFDNKSTHSPNSPPFTSTSFIWDFGDRTGLVQAGLGPTTHSYVAPGPYNVSLILADTNYCNFPDTLTVPFYVAQRVQAQFTTPALGCAPYNAVFNNTSIAGLTYYWDFGDGSPIDSVDRSPVHLYPNVGTYTVTLIAVDSTTCNVTDTFRFTITVQGKPAAGFTFAPYPPVPNTPTVFTDASSPGVKYEWIFGDGSSTTKATPDTVIHQYNRTDTFQACLVVTNASGCSDTVCHPVPTIINPLLDVPNAFTPGRFGMNGVIRVVGFGIVHMDFRIYNRWGQLVFASNDPTVGWDGTYRGVLQPVDVYGYTLEAEFSDGTHTRKKGDITLLR